MKRVLFVDDEPMVLKSLQALMRPYRAVWHMVFVNGAEAALAELQRGAFDVVVSDLRMPNIDGAELMRRVEQLSPSTARLILTGSADEASMQRARAAAHQLLSKPCDTALLCEAIDPGQGRVSK